MSIVKYESFDAPEVAALWKKLETNNPSCSVFQTYAWSRAWEECYGGKTEHSLLLIFQLDVSGEPVALAPLMVRQGEMRFLMDSCSDYSGIVVAGGDPCVIDELLDAVMEAAGPRRMLFWNLRPEAWATAALEAACARYRLPLWRSTQPVYRALLNRAEAGSYWETRGRNLRRNYARRSGALRALGVEFRQASALPPACLQQVTKVSSERCAQQGRASPFDDSRRTDFLKRVADIRDSDRSFVLFGLWLDSELVAYRLGFLQKECYFDWNTAFRPCFGKWSPGLALLGMIVDEFLDQEQPTVIDFLRGAEEYKTAWANMRTELLTLEVLPDAAHLGRLQQLHP